LALALAGLLFVYLTSPTRLTVVVGPPGSAEKNCPISKLLNAEITLNATLR